MKDLNVWCEVVCNGCCVTMEGEFYHQGTIGWLRERAVNAGWKVINGETLCPRCAELHKKKG
jgi:hypothetical protein